jgi:hypothetical protein
LVRQLRIAGKRMVWIVVNVSSSEPEEEAEVVTEPKRNIIERNSIVFGTMRKTI